MMLRKLLFTSLCLMISLLFPKVNSENTCTIVGQLLVCSKTLPTRENMEKNLQKINILSLDVPTLRAPDFSDVSYAFTEVEKFKIDESKIEKIESRFFKKMLNKVRLKKIVLENIHPLELTPEPFFGLESELNALILANLDNVDGAVIDMFENLKTLSLSSVTFKENTPLNLTSQVLKEIYIKDASLDTIPWNTFMQVLNKKGSVTLENVRTDCSSDLRPFLENRNDVTFNKTFQGIICANPTRLKGKTLVELADSDLMNAGEGIQQVNKNPNDPDGDSTPGDGTDDGDLLKSASINVVGIAIAVAVVTALLIVVVIVVKVCQNRKNKGQQYQRSTKHTQMISKDGYDPVDA